MARLARLRAACAPQPIDELLQRLQAAVLENQRLARQRQACAREMKQLAHRQQELARVNRRCLTLVVERCDTSRARLEEARAATPATLDPSLQSRAFELDVFYVQDDVECHLAIRTGPGTHLSVMFVSRASRHAHDDASAGVSHVTRIALRPELSERPENLANQILRTLFADGDPLRHAPQRGERSKIFADLMRWAARYQAFRAPAALTHAAAALPPPAPAQ